MGMEVCCTLGMLNGEQAKQLKEAGLTAYNHNLDTSREFYPSVITTRRVVQHPAIVSLSDTIGKVSCTRGISYLDDVCVVQLMLGAWVNVHMIGRENPP